MWLLLVEGRHGLPQPMFYLAGCHPRVLQSPCSVDGNKAHVRACYLPGQKIKEAAQALLPSWPPAFLSLSFWAFPDANWPYFHVLDMWSGFPFPTTLSFCFLWISLTHRSSCVGCRTRWGSSNEFLAVQAVFPAQALIHGSTFCLKRASQPGELLKEMPGGDRFLTALPSLFRSSSALQLTGCLYPPNDLVWCPPFPDILVFHKQAVPKLRPHTVSLCPYPR